MKKILVLSALLFTLTFAFWGCGPDDDSLCKDCIGLSSCDSSNTVYIPTELKNYFNFKKGTYWVYKNIDSNKEDSLWIWTSRNVIIVEPELKKKCEEVFVYNYSSLLSGNWDLNCRVISPYVEDYTFGVYYGNSDNNSDLLRFDYTKNAFISPTQSGGNVSKIDSIYVNKIVYKDILFLNYINLTNSVEIYQQAYYAPNIGLVKYKSKNGDTWHLVRHNIE